MPGSERCYPALLAEEIFIVQMHGREDEALRLEEILEKAPCEGAAGPAFPDLPHEMIVEILAMAEAIRDRQKLGMHWNCCWRCQSFLTCQERRARTKADVRCNCCRKCEQYSDCHRKCTQ